MKINDHELVNAPDAGNGYHGRCKHCGVALETDLGYCSWDNLKCVDREIVNWLDIPEEIKAYANFRGLNWDKVRKIYVKPYRGDEYTLDQLNIVIKSNNG